MEESQPLSAAKRGAEWILALQQQDGSFHDTECLEAYYKAPFGLVVTGYNPQAERMLDYIEKRFLQQDGDLDGSGVGWWEQFRTYPHSWLTIAALMRGRFRIAHSLLRTLLDYHDEASGGFFTSTEGSKLRVGRQEIMTTSLAALACLWAGRLDVATRAGAWLRRIWEAQPDVSKGLYQVWDARTGLVTEFPASEAKTYFVNALQPAQWYFQYGASAAFLSALAAATQANPWLELAHKFLYASKHCREDVYRRPASGKVGWGAAWCYRLSGDPVDREICLAVIEGLGDLQNDDGSWSATGVRRDKSPPCSVADIDVTAEFTGLLGTMAMALQ
jgi:hypothetical protein